MGISFSIDRGEHPSEANVSVLHRLLREHNQQANPVWWSRMDEPENQPRDLAVFVSEGDDALIAGLLGSTSLSWVRIDIMAVRPDRRRRGIGRELLRCAETEAVARGCRYAFVDTMDYQSPEFYRRCGYEAVGSIPDWDSHGHAKWYFTKALD